MRALLLSAYHAPSHQRWADGLVDQLSGVEFELNTQPPRHFPWRSRGNSLWWAFDDTIQCADPDVIVATSMVDLAGLRGLVPHLATRPTLAYFHENQFAYPTRDDRTNANLLVTNLYTALAADRVLFNSMYNRQSFLRRAGEFLDLMPDQVPDGVIEQVHNSSDVLPVPLEQAVFDRADALRSDTAGGNEPLRIIWNHRWEYDKAPQRFFRALFRLADNLDFRLVVMGQQFREAPPIFEQARDRLADHIDHWGWVEDRDDYLRWLIRGDLVVSTAVHDFQGLAVQEAVVCGCLPVLPDRVAYPDFFDDVHLYPSSLDDASADIDALAKKLRTLLADPKRTRAMEVPDLSDLSWSNLKGEYRAEIESLVR